MKSVVCIFRWPWEKHNYNFFLMTMKKSIYCHGCFSYAEVWGSQLFTILYKQYVGPLCSPFYSLTSSCSDYLFAIAFVHLFHIPLPLHFILGKVITCLGGRDKITELLCVCLKVLDLESHFHHDSCSLMAQCVFK